MTIPFGATSVMLARHPAKASLEWRGRGGLDMHLAMPSREFYDRNGFVLVEGVVSRDETVALASLLETGLRRRNVGEDRPISERAALNRQLTHCFNLWEEEPRVLAVALDARICSIAHHLLDAPSIRLFVDQTFFKEPGAEPTSKHHDITRWPVRGKLLTAWIALDDVTEGSGALAYIPGSQGAGPSSWLDLVTGRQWSEAARELIDGPAVHVPVRRGSVLFHDSCVFHFSSPNRSNRRRRAFAVAYAADGTSRSSSLPFPVLDWDGVRVGDRLTGPRTPIAWPRPERSLPPPPPPPSEELEGWPSRVRFDGAK